MYTNLYENYNNLTTVISMSFVKENTLYLIWVYSNVTAIQVALGGEVKNLMGTDLIIEIILLRRGGKCAGLKPHCY